MYYFHQVDDPYSFIMAQQLTRFADIASVRIKPFLVSDPAAPFKGDAKRFDAWATADAANIAPFFGEALPIASGAESSRQPNDTLREAAEAALSPMLEADLSIFTAEAQRIGLALWRHHSLLKPSLQERAHAETCIAAGDSLRASLGHFQGGTLYFDGEWYWGVDRLPLLLARLKEEGHSQASVNDFDIYAAGSIRPLAVSSAVNHNITLEYFPSLRSPYTAVGHSAVEDLVARSHVALNLRPVMPMLMRGVTAPQPKQRFILSDSVREARAKGIAFRNFVDPFGDSRRASRSFRAQGLRARAWLSSAPISTLPSVRVSISIRSEGYGKSSRTQAWTGKHVDHRMTPTGSTFSMLTLILCYGRGYGVCQLSRQ